MNLIDTHENTTTTPPSIEGQRAEAAGLNQLLGILNSPDLNDGVVQASEAVSVSPITNSNVVVQQHPKPQAIPATRVVFGDRVCTTGRLKAGKDTVLGLLGCAIYGFADPLYELQRLFFGNDDKSAPGAREFLQAAGQWGRGTINDKYPLTATRAVFVTMLCTMGGAGLIPRKWGVKWEDYGKTDSLWVDAMLSRIEQGEGRIGVSNVRFDNEQKALTDAGFKSFHVLCSGSTWEDRLRASGMSLNSPALKDTSEQLAISMEKAIAAEVRKNPRGPKLRVIWSDRETPCPSPRFITLADIENSK